MLRLAFLRQCRLAVLIALAFVALSVSTPASAEFESKAEFAILMDMDTGAILYQKNADELMSPASMSKLMTLELVFKALKEGQLKPDDTFFLSENAWRKGGGVSGTSSMFVELNTEERLSELLQGIIVQSGNDACIAIAEGMAGTEDAFARMMTDRARELGLERSTFGNSTGLPHPGQLVTARELAMLAKHLITEYPTYYRYFSQDKFFYKKYRFYNRNKLINLDIGIDGLKTGFTREAGYGIVASGKQRGRRLILVVNGLKSKRERRNEARRLYEWGIKGFKEFKLFDAEEKVGSARVWGGSSFFVPLVGDGAVRVLLPRYSDSKTKLEAVVAYNGPLKPPIRRGQQVAVLRVSGQGDAVSEVPLYAGEDVEEGGIITKGFDSLLHLAFGWLP